MRGCQLIGVCLLVLCLLAPGAGAQGAPFTSAAPAGWSWWQGEAGLALLPDEAAPGDQRRFFIVSRRPVEDWLPGWAGGGKVEWQGPLKAPSGTWDAQIAAGQGNRALLGASADGGGWSFAAVSPAGKWPADAAVYNGVLKGGGP